MKDVIIKLYSRNIDRVGEPITFGIPLPEGEITNADTMRLLNENKEIISLQACPMMLWPDNSIKWLLIDFQATVRKKERLTYRIIGNESSITGAKGILIEEIDDCFVVDTGVTKFFLDHKIFRPFSKIITNENDVIYGRLSKTILIDDENSEYEPVINNIKLEAFGFLRSVIKIEGAFANKKKIKINFISRIHFYFNKSFVKIDFTIWNSRPSRHLNGLWDLGDPGSVYFKDLSITTSIRDGGPLNINWQMDVANDNRLNFEKASDFSIYQDSSGGENWKSKNHINQNGEIPLSFKGFKVTKNDKTVFEGNRANPVLCLGDNNIVSCAILKFWQNFPKALDIKGNQLIVRLFPKYFGDLYELQGGERKTHSVFMEYGNHPPCFISMLDPIQSSLPPEWYKETNALSYYSLSSDCEGDEYESLIQNVVQGHNSFFEKREIIDEYGWRNFGEVYADHEAVGYQGNPPLISHYNNQYDFIYSAFRQYTLKGDSLWFELMDDLARHLVDIDIYHTEKDRSEYNNALFWHTNHYLDAATCTHRSESVDHLNYSNPLFCGGGPALEHNYTTGLMYHYLVTGEHPSKEAVILLADWVIRLMDRPETFVALLQYMKNNFFLWKQVFKGEEIRYDRFPFTRESGNCISVLLDAFNLTNNKKYMEKAEETIRGCIHPNDNIGGRDLLNSELNWSYTACLQGIGKYIDFKYSLHEFDSMYYYAIVSLRDYAKWMVDNEYPYLDKSEKLEYPNETWPAQDFRKSCVFYFAAKYSEGDWRDLFLEKGKFYYDYAINKILEFNTKTLARPLVLLLQNGYMHHYFSNNKYEKVNVIIPKDLDFYNDNENFTKARIFKILFSQIKVVLKSTSIKKEINWVRNRLYKHT